MKKTSSPKPGNRNKQVSHVKRKPPEMHDSVLRRQPPSPQDIQRVQPLSQTTPKDQPGKFIETKTRPTIHKSKKP